VGNHEYDPDHDHGGPEHIIDPGPMYGGYRHAEFFFGIEERPEESRPSYYKESQKETRINAVTQAHPLGEGATVYSAQHLQAEEQIKNYS
jgi:hypothetical protein